MRSATEHASLWLTSDAYLTLEVAQDCSGVLREAGQFVEVAQRRDEVDDEPAATSALRDVARHARQQPLERQSSHVVLKRSGSFRAPRVKGVPVLTYVDQVFQVVGRLDLTRFSQMLREPLEDNALTRDELEAV